MNADQWEQLLGEIDALCKEIDLSMAQLPEWRKLEALRSVIAVAGGAAIQHPLGGGRLPSPGGRGAAARLPRLERLDLKAVTAVWRAAGGAGIESAGGEDLAPLEVKATVAAARAGAGERAALLLFTVASVQEFVAAARRTQDLWFGSYLFSYLMWRAMQAIGEQVGYDVFLLPTLQRQPLLLRALGERPRTEELVIANLPNIFTALLPADRAEALARCAEAALWQARDEIFEDVKRGVELAARSAAVHTPALASDSAWEGAWTRQRIQFLQSNVFWAIVPWSQESEYAAASIEAGRLLSARKTLRQFFQEGEPDGAEKCTLCGVRAALHPTGQGAYGRLRSFWESLAKVEGDGDVPKLAGRIRRGDRLCAVCVTKRLALQVHFTRTLDLNYHLFPSTASVAVAPFVERVLSQEGGIAEAARQFAISATDFLRRVGIHHPANPVPKLAARGEHPLLELDGQWLYPESWTPEAIAGEAGEMGIRPDELLLDGAAVAAAVAEGKRRVDRQELDGLRGRLGELLRKSQEAGIRPPSRYFAVLALDGDQMGEWIGGRKGLALTPEYHVALAVALRNFALRLAPVAVEEQAPAKLVYAGGDDVLALLPVESVLPVLRALRAFFRGEVSGDSRDAVPVGWSVGGGFVTERDGTAHLVMGPRADFSAGVVLVHHSHPLSHAVEEAQRVLKEHAKKRLGRSAVAFRLMKRSGEPLTTGIKWALPPGPPGQAAVSEPLDLLQLLQKLVTATRAKQLSPSLSHDMRREREGLEGLAAEVQKRLLRYLVERRPGGHESSDLVVSLFTAIAGGAGASDSPWDQTADLFEVVRFLASEGMD